MQTHRGNCSGPIVWSDVAIRREQWRTHRTRCTVFTRTLHPLGSSLSLSPNIRIPSKSALTGGKNRRCGPLNNRSRPHRREESSSIGSSQNPPADAICGGLKPGEKMVDALVRFMRQKEKIFLVHCRVNLFERFEHDILLSWSRIFF